MERHERIPQTKEDLATAGKILLIAALALLLFALTSNAQAEETLFGSKKLSTGGFGGPQVLYTQFNGEDGMLVGGQGAWVINEKIYIGGGGYGLVTHHDGPADPRYQQTPQLMMGYGGAMVGFIVRNDDLIHLAGDVMIGGGGMSNVVELRSGDPSFDLQDDNYKTLKTEGFWHVQPMAHVEMNVTTWMRVSASAGYRFVHDLNSFDLTDEDASGPVAGLTVRFGHW